MHIWTRAGNVRTCSNMKILNDPHIFAWIITTICYVPASRNRKLCPFMRSFIKPPPPTFASVCSTYFMYDKRGEYVFWFIGTLFRIFYK